MSQAVTQSPNALYEWGYHCKKCRKTTIHYYIGPQRDRDGEIILHLWNCTVCESTISGISPEEAWRKSVRIDIRRMRQRRAKRRYG